MTITAFVDAIGVYGSMLHYGLVVAFVGTAFLLFIYLWKNGRLDMDEGPKFQMMDRDSDKGEKHHE